MNTAAEIEINEFQLKKIAKNLRILLNEHSKSENDVAQALNIPVMTVRRLVSGETTDPRISTLKIIADYFNVSVDSLIDDNTSPISMGKSMPKFVPVLDWKTTSTINSLENIDLRSWKNWHPVTLGNQLTLSNNAFALESRPSMQPRFPLGTIFIIDPCEAPNDGDIILIKMKNNGDLSLREIIIDSPRCQLQPIIAGSESLFYDDNDHHIVGVVILTILHSRKTKYST